MIRTSVFLSLLIIASPAVSEPPRSVIPWLSDSLLHAPEHHNSVVPEITSIPDQVISEIETSTLDAPLRDGVGILTTKQTGFPTDLWGRTSALRVRRMILDHPGIGVPAARQLFHEILQAETSPPPGSTGQNLVLLARIDRLMEHGQLDQAEALVELAGITSPEMFLRAFDVGLLTERSEKVCDTLRVSPALSPTLPARVYCLARLGDWDAAALTLGLGHQLGDISPEQEETLARFLDPELFEGTENPPIPDPLTTLDFVIRDAVALPRPPGTLPLAFVHLDIGEHAGLRSRIISGERLVREVALPGSVLFSAYRSGKPAASGGIWEHAAAVQALDKAFEDEDKMAIIEKLVKADDIFSDIGLRLNFADDVADRLPILEGEHFNSDVRHRVYSLLMLAERWSDARRFMADNNDVNDHFFRALAEPGTSFPAENVLGPLRLAAARGLTRADAPSETAAFIATRIDDGHLGEGILRALEFLAAGTEIDPGDLEAGIWLLRRAGLTGKARNIAAQTLILLPEA